MSAINDKDASTNKLAKDLLRNIDETGKPDKGATMVAVSLMDFNYDFEIRPKLKR